MGSQFRMKTQQPSNNWIKLKAIELISRNSYCCDADCKLDAYTLATEIAKWVRDFDEKILSEDEILKRIDEETR